MPKNKIHFCKKCSCLTEQIYKGKVDKRGQSEKEYDKIATVATLGMYALVNKALEKPRKKHFECTKCGSISEI